MLTPPWRPWRSPAARAGVVAASAPNAEPPYRSRHLSSVRESQDLSPRSWLIGDEPGRYPARTNAWNVNNNWKEQPTRCDTQEAARDGRKCSGFVSRVRRSGKVDAAIRLTSEGVKMHPILSRRTRVAALLSVGTVALTCAVTTGHPDRYGTTSHAMTRST